MKTKIPSQTNPREIVVETYAVIEIPTPPDCFKRVARDATSQESYVDVSELSDEACLEIANEWGRALMKHAQARRAKRKAAEVAT